MGSCYKVYINLEKDANNLSQLKSFYEIENNEINKYKADLFSLIMSTPNDITPKGEEAYFYLKTIFNELMDGLQDSIINEFSYGIVSDDAEFNEESDVIHVWEEEEKERIKETEERNKRLEFFKRHKGVLDEYNFDDIELYNKWKDGKIVIQDNLTKIERDALVEKMKIEHKEELKKALEELRSHE